MESDAIPAVPLDRMVRRVCVVSDCGARVRNQNPKTKTCSPECTRAKHAGRTREEQIRYEMDHPETH